MNDLPVTRLVESLASGEISSVDATSAYLERIERLDGSIGAYWTVDADGALEQAMQADSATKTGRQLGALHGLPVALKDNIDTAGLRTTNGAAFLADRVPEVDAEVTRRLREGFARRIDIANWWLEHHEEVER